MQQNYQTTRPAGLGSNVGIGYPPNASWTDPNNITVDDGNSAQIGFFQGGQHGDNLVASDFGFNLPPGATIDGIAVFIDGFQVGVFGGVSISPADTEGKDLGNPPLVYGGSDDLWGAQSISLEDLADLTVTVDTNDVSGGDGVADVQYLTVTVFWHIDLATAPADVPTRVEYKVYSRDGEYLGNLPNVTSPFAFPQDMNSAGSSLEVTCGVSAENTVTTEPLITGDGDEIITGTGEPILAQLVDTMLALGASSEKAIFKNSNRVKIWMYNYWHPNGKLMFSGQVNKVTPKYAGGNSYTRLLIISDGLDLNNLIARGYPFSYTTDISQTSQNGYVTVTQGSGKAAGQYTRYGQTWRSGASANNVGAIQLRLLGTANVTLSIYDHPNGNLLGSVTKSVAAAAATNIQFEFPQLIPISPNTDYFMAISVPEGKSMRVYKHGTSSTYANGTMYIAQYAGGSGGGGYGATTGDFYFVTKYGTPTTTATYSSQDPTTGMMSGIMADYNARGGFITERDFEPTGLSLTYTFNMAFIFDALKKVLELSPTGFYSYIDLGTAEMDILPMSETADFTVVRGRDAVDLELSLSIEQVKNYLLFTGGPAPTTNLYRDYQDSESAAYYGTRTVPKTDNRVTTTATADAIGDTFIEENSDETQETTLVVPVTAMDTTLLVPGKTIGFRNFGNFIDALVLPIARREFNTKTVTLTLGRLPVRMNDEIQRINRGLLNEQTINNPNAPS